MSRPSWLALGVALGATVVLSCGQTKHPPAFDLPEGGTGAGGSGGAGVGGLLVGDGGMDAALCGDQEIPAVTDPPNLYFIVDRSGSMSDTLPGSPYSKYENARIAISKMLRAIGHRVRYGVGVFPSFTSDGCAPGLQIFATVAGDPPTFAERGTDGPNLTHLLEQLGQITPAGSTPTAASLSALEPTILGLTGKKTYVVLMTDGAPNCNVDLKCGPDACIPNIEHESISGTNCDAAFNCCDPKLVGEQGVGYCVDADATVAAVADYEANGVDTYVVGMPGSEEYSQVLGRAALAGNTARPGNMPYYAVSDTTELTAALRSIGAQVAISCALPLTDAPEDPNLVNVYFDRQLVPKNDSNGWHYTGEKSIEFSGASCKSLSSGDVLNVQVLAGCPTVVR